VVSSQQQISRASASRAVARSARRINQRVAYLVDKDSHNGSSDKNAIALGKRTRVAV